MQNAKEIIKNLIAKNNYNFEDLCNLVSVLRSDDGCPWDREQTNESIRNAFIEETYEFVEGLDLGDDKLMCEELGDVLFQIVFHADLKSDSNAFDMGDVIDGICKKMIIRHPHVFSDTRVENSSEVLVNWENIKNYEKQRKTPYEQLDSVAKSLPSLIRAQKLRAKAEKNNLCEKCILEDSVNETMSLLDELNETKSPEILGKILFNLCGISSIIDADAEQTLYIENDKFQEKFK